MRVLLPLLVVSAAGCDALFGLDRIELDADGGGDGLDAVTCTTIGHDEDGDGLDDACDPCPFDSRNEGDEDGDGIALACDPDPGTANEVLIFSGFDGATRSAFTVFEGSFVGDSFRGIGQGTAALLWGDQVDRVWVTAGLSVDALESTQYREIGVIFDAQVTTESQPNGTYCVLGRNGDADYLEVFGRLRPAGDVLVNNSQSSLPLLGFRGTMRATTARLEMPATACTFATDTMEATVSGTRTPPPAPGKLALVMYNMDAAFEFLFVVRRP